MLNWVDEQIREQYRRDLLREADHDRLIAKARGEQPKARRFYGPVVVQLGRWLVTLGCNLQSRYGAIVEIPVAAVAPEPIATCSSSNS